MLFATSLPIKSKAIANKHDEEENDDENEDDTWFLPERERSAFDIFTNFDDEKDL